MMAAGGLGIVPVLRLKRMKHTERSTMGDVRPRREKKYLLWFI